MKTLNIEKKMPSKGDGSTAKALKKLASESPREEFELDLGSILEELKDWKKENPGKKIAPEKNQRKRKNPGLNKKNPHLRDEGFVLKAGLEPARILLSIGF